MSLRDWLVTVGMLILLPAAALFLLRWRCTDPRIRLFILARYPLLAASLQIGLGALGFCNSAGVKSYVGNVFVLDAEFQLCQVTWISLLLATTCIVMYRTVEVSAAKRFCDFRNLVEHYLETANPQKRSHGWCQKYLRSLLHPRFDTRNRWGMRWFYLLALALPVPVAAFTATSADLVAVTGTSSQQVEARLAGWMVAGVLVWLALMALTASIQQLFIYKQATDFGLFPLDGMKLVPDRMQAYFQRGGRWLANEIARLGPGFSESRDGGTRLLPGHGQLAIYTLVLGTAYAISVIFFSDPKTHFRSPQTSIPRQDAETVGFFRGPKTPLPASLAQISIPRIVQARTIIFSSNPMSFSLWPFPPIPAALFPTLFSIETMILMSALVLSGAAFFFDYWRIPIVPVFLLVSVSAWKLAGADSFYEAQKGNGVTELAENALKLPLAADGKRTLVIVTAAGGGIQASAWTAEVLTGLHEQYKNLFTRSIGVISAVSGGSVGAMFVLDPWMREGGLPVNNQNVIDGIRSRARRSSLEATAQAMSGWDLVKVLAPYLAPKFEDRGWAIEQSWSIGMTDGNATLSQWGKALNEHHFPIVAFNATDVETGARFVVCNALLPDPQEGFDQEIKLPQCTEFFSKGQQADLKILTGARLSATFPFVSPICRAPDTPAIPGTPTNHVADGGYIDNEGLFTAMQWLNHLLVMRQNGHAQFDRVLILRIVPFPPSDNKREFLQLGWLYAFIGPLEALVNVRDASQISRNMFDLGLLKKAFGNSPGPQNISNNDGKLPVEIVECQFSTAGKQPESPPVSWKLSRRQQRAIQEGWNDVKGGVFKKLDQWFK